MGEFASKGVAGSGLGLGIAGTALGLLNSNGILGGLMGGGNSGYCTIAQKDAEIAQLRSEKYADNVGIETYKQTRIENNELGDRILGNWVKPLAQESAANRERIATLEAEMKCENEKTILREQLIEQRFATANSEMLRHVDDVANKSACGIAANAAGIAALRSVVDGITVTHIPASSICPEVMPRWNSWVEPTAQAPATQPVTGTVNVGS